MVRPRFTVARNTFESNATFFIFLTMTDPPAPQRRPVRIGCLGSPRQSVSGFGAERKCRHGTRFRQLSGAFRKTNAQFEIYPYDPGCSLIGISKSSILEPWPGSRFSPGSA